MSATAGRRLRHALTVSALLPSVAVLLLVRPAPASGQSPAIGFHALTYAAAAIEPTGDIGAGGGLLPLDGGAPVVRARVDGAPSAVSTAASVEPGTLWATVAGVANSEAGEEVIPTPTRAEALYPGNREASASQFGPEEAGPLRVGAGTAVASASRGGASGRAELGTWRLAAASSAQARGLALSLAELRLRHPDAPRVRAQAEQDAGSILLDAGRAHGVARAEPEAGAQSVRAEATVGELVVLGQFVLHGVQAFAEAEVRDGERRAAATLEIAAARLGDFPVVLGPDGVQVTEGDGLDATQARALSDELNAALEQAGVQARLLPARHDAGDGYAEADSGGVRVTVATPSDGGVPGNTVGLLLGRVSVTSADEPGPTGASSAPGPSVSEGSDSGGFAPAPFTGTAPTAGGGLDPGAVSPPGVAEPDAPRRVLLAGRVIPATAALAAFAVWQLLSLSTATLAALALRDRERTA